MFCGWILLSINCGDDDDHDIDDDEVGDSDDDHDIDDDDDEVGDSEGKEGWLLEAPDISLSTTNPSFASILYFFNIYFFDLYSIFLQYFFRISSKFPICLSIINQRMIITLLAELYPLCIKKQFIYDGPPKFTDY